MSLLKTLDLAITVANRKRDEAGQALAQAQQRQIAAQQQLDQLRSYAHETETRWESQARVCAMPELMQHHYQFMARLDQAVQMQLRNVADQAQWVALAQKALLAADLRVATLRQVRAHKQAEIDRLQRRREQRAMDEMAANRYALSVREQALEMEHGH
jgi:flagellar FliJ protein